MNSMAIGIYGVEKNGAENGGPEKVVAVYEIYCRQI